MVVVEVGQMVFSIQSSPRARLNGTRGRGLGHKGCVAGGSAPRVRRVHGEVVKVAQARYGPAHGVDGAVVVREQVHGPAGQGGSSTNWKRLVSGVSTKLSVSHKIISRY